MLIGFSSLRPSHPFLPKSPKCLKPGYLAKVIAKNGRIIDGRIRYIGPIVSHSSADANTHTNYNLETFVGLQLSSSIGDCDGTYEGRKFFECKPHHGIFVPFKKVVMAWA